MGKYGEPPAKWAALYPDRVDQWDDVAGGWLVRQQEDGTVVHVVPLMFTTAILVSPRLGAPTYVDRWCYSGPDAAFAAVEAWEGLYPASEPQGWHRHPTTGRRRENGDPSREIVEF